MTCSSWAILLGLTVASTGIGAPGSAAADAKRQAEASIERGEGELREPARPRAALALFEGGLARAQEVGDPILLSRGFLGRARAQMRLGDVESGLASARKAATAARLSGDARAEGQALDQMGNAAYFLGDYAAALEHFEAALARTRGTGDLSDEAALLKDVGIALKGLGELDRALFALTQSREKAELLGNDSLMVAILGNMGSLYERLGARRLALVSYERELTLAELRGVPSEILDAHTRIGTIEPWNQMGEEARRHLEAALAIAKAHRFLIQQGWIEDLLATLEARMGSMESAAATHRAALAIWKRLKYEASIRYNLSRLGLLLVESDPEGAERLLREALTVPERQGLRWTWMPQGGLGRLFRRRGDFERAIGSFEDAVRRLEAYRQTIQSEEERVELVAENRGAYDDLLEALLGAGRGERAFDLSERARTFGIRSAAAPSSPPEERDDDLRGREEALQSKISLLRKSVGAAPPDSALRRERLEELEGAEVQYDELLVDRRRRSRVAPDEAAPSTLRLLQERLPGDTAFLSYLVTETGVAAFAVTAHSFRTEKLAVSPSELSERVHAYVDLIAEEKTDGLSSTARRLSRDLIEPFLPALSPGIRKLVIAPDGPLHFLPFETLLVRGEPRRYLIEDFAISYVPSATVLSGAAAGQTATREPARVLVVASGGKEGRGTRAGERDRAALARDLYEEEGLVIAPLPYAAAEAEAVGRYAGAGGEVLIGTEATERRVKGLRLDQFQVLHFAAHGLLSRWSAARSALVLSPGGPGEDGFLQAREISRMRLNSDLVVLSGCRTARGRSLSGRGVQGLAEAFLRAGARTVVGSLWNVNDRDAAELMSAFYRHLASGASKAEALRAAKLDLLRHSGDLPPRSWAPFVLIGEPAGTIPLQPLSWWRRLVARFG